MCGIAGFWENEGRADPKAILETMAAALVHRGPDAGGVWSDAEAGVGLAHRRLAILELSRAGAQPMQSASGRFVLSFNGEIYNHLAIREELTACGWAHPWQGRSDTETLLAAVETWGLRGALKRCAGMFALALWDRRERRLTLARDRMGEKPLYYGWTGHRRSFVFGSELKALRAFPGFDNLIDRQALALYFQFSAVPAPHSIYSGVYKLSPGCLLEIDVTRLAAQTTREEPYWELTAVATAGLTRPYATDAEAIGALDAALSQAVAQQAIADVPLGAFLSGGVDSSLIVALMQARGSRPVRTFTIGFDEAGFDEAPHAAAVARHLGTDHHEIRITARETRDVIPMLPTLYDEPFADSSQIPTFLVCRAARQQVTVALSGDAGDELFGGYNRYLWWPKLRRRLGWAPRPALAAARALIQATPLDLIASAGRFAPGLRRVGQLGEKAHKLAQRLPELRDDAGLYRSAVSNWPPGTSLVLGVNAPPVRELATPTGVDSFEQRMMLWDALAYLPDDVLTKVDRAAMGASLETRAPMLDHRVVEVAWRMPLHMKIRDGVSKWALRQILFQHVPPALIERPKAGFAIPVGHWLRADLRDWAEALLDPARLVREGYLDPQPITEAWRQHLSGRRDWTPQLWSVLMFQAWLETNALGDSARSA